MLAAVGNIRQKRGVSARLISARRDLTGDAVPNFKIDATLGVSRKLASSVSTLLMYKAPLTIHQNNLRRCNHVVAIDITIDKVPLLPMDC